MPIPCYRPATLNLMRPIPRHATQSPDTSPWADAVMMRAYRAMSPIERIRRIGELGRMVEAVALAGLRQDFPMASNRELKLRLAARRHPARVMRAFGWDPDTETFIEPTSLTERA